MNERALKQEQVEVLARIRSTAGRHAEVVAELVALLAHAKAIVAAEALGHGSLFDYCRRVLNLSRDQAYRYLACADVVTKQPQVMAALKMSRLNATGVAALAPYVKANSVEDGARILERAEGKTVEAIAMLMAELMPKADVNFSVRPSPVASPAAQPDLLATVETRATRQAAVDEPVTRNPAEPVSGDNLKSLCFRAGREPSRAGPTERDAAASASLRAEAHTHAKIAPLSSTSYKLTMTVSAEAYRDLLELRDLSSHIIPSGQLDKVIAHGIRLAVKHARRAKWKTMNAPTLVAAATATVETSSAGPVGMAPTAATPAVEKSAATATAPAVEKSAATAVAPAVADSAATESAPAMAESVATAAVRAVLSVGTPPATATSRTTTGAAVYADGSASSNGASGRGNLVDQTTRRFPSAPLRRAVYIRDGGRCAFVGRDGRCRSTWQVEVDHIIRVADGGLTALANLRLCCRRHNQAREVAA